MKIMNESDIFRLRLTVRVFAEEWEVSGALLGIPVAVGGVVGVADVLFGSQRRSFRPRRKNKRPAVSPLVGLVILILKK